MKYFIEEETGIAFDFDYKDIFKKTVDAALSLFSCPYECEVNLLLTDNEKIKQINSETRNIDKITDVLSFPNVTFDKPGDFSLINDDYVFDPDSNDLMLGDIVLSAEKVLSQALEYGHSNMREYAFLIAHSMLHLLGFDHMNDTERLIMESKQDEIMEILNISR